MYYKFVKFHKNSISGLGGVALTRYMDGRTDGQGDSYIPTPKKQRMALLIVEKKYDKMYIQNYVFSLSLCQQQLRTANPLGFSARVH